MPVVGMGTWRTFDVRGAAAEARCRAVLDEAYAAGATLFDTSAMYGAAERVLSESMGARRADALVASVAVHSRLWTIRALRQTLLTTRGDGGAARLGFAASVRVAN